MPRMLTCEIICTWQWSTCVYKAWYIPYLYRRHSICIVFKLHISN